MIVLGIDPGSHRTGWGVVEILGSRLVHVASGTIVGEGEGLPSRLRCIADRLEQVLDDHRPEAVAVEMVFQARNAQSALMLGHARGMALLCAARRNLPVFEYAPGRVKRATTGCGRAEKEQVQTMVCLILGHRAKLSLDASDALAVAICHAQAAQSPLTAQLQASPSPRSRARRRARVTSAGREDL